MDFGFDEHDSTPVERVKEAKRGAILTDDALDGLFDNEGGEQAHSSSVATKTVKPVGAGKPTLQLDDDFLEKAAEQASYSTEHRSALGKIKEVEKEGNTYIIIDGEELKLTSERVNPKKTIVWAGNPRLFEQGETNIEDLLPHIHHTKGNTMPAYGRKAVHDGEDVIEIIAGSRRRLACIRGGYDLLVNLIECNDSQALLLTEQENEGREGTTFIAGCRWHLAQYESVKAAMEEQGGKYTQEQYATSRNSNLTKMQDYFSFARFPDWLTQCIRDQSTLSYRSCNTLRKLLRTETEDLQRVCTENQFEKATQLIKHFQKPTKKQLEVDKSQDSVNTTPKVETIEKIVEKRVEIPVPTIIEVPTETIIEVPVVKVVEKRVEIPVEKIVEKRIEVPVEKIVEKRVEVPVENVDEKTIEVAAEIHNKIISTNSLTVNGVKAAIQIHEMEEGIQIHIDDLVNTRLVDAIKETVEAFTK
tara:strand:+ start:2006 stop:3424 length:1419 start_codon:yes stop_codon:yes gene_type:complete